MTAKIHVEVFVAAQLLSRSQGTFTAHELKREINRLFGDIRPGVSTHVSAHCVANVQKNAQTVYNYLWRLDHGLLRAFNPLAHSPDPTRADAPYHPNAEDLSLEYRYLLPA